MTRSMLVKIERGEKSPSADKLTALCDVLGLDWVEPAVRLKKRRRRAIKTPPKNP